MPRSKKTHKIKRSYHRASRQEKLRQANEDNADEENKTERGVSENVKEEGRIGSAVKVDPREICNLSDEQRLRIKSEHPEMNEYFLMSARQKSKFFHLLNQKYRQDTKLAEPPGSAPMKKTIKFKKRFEIRAFSYAQKSNEINNTRSFMELYKAKDESKPRSISKFPRNA